MAVADWLAGIGGAAQGIDRTRQEANRIELQKMLAQLQADTSTENNKRTVAGAGERAAGAADVRKQIADANRDQRAAAVLANTNLGYTKIAANEGLGYTREAGRNNRADDRLGFLWEKLNEDEAAKYAGQSSTASTARYGMDLAHQDRGAALEQSAGASRARTALGVLGLRAREKPPLPGSPAQDPTDWADEFDRLYNRGASPDDLTGLGADGAPMSAPAAVPAPAPPPGDGLPSSGGRPPMPPPRVMTGDDQPTRRPMPSGRKPLGVPRGASAIAGPRPQTGGPATSTKTVTIAQLQQVAAARGTTVDEEKQRAATEGYVVVR